MDLACENVTWAIAAEWHHRGFNRERHVIIIIIMEVTCDPVAQAWMKSTIKRMDTTLGPDSSEGQGHLFST